jgi:esterase
MLAYSEIGPDTGTPLLIAHGLFGSGRNWGVIAKRLAENRRVITVDMRNHGNSFWSDKHEYSDLANDLAQVIDRFGGPMDVLGHSMGGKAAMMLALSHPDMVRRLVIGDIAPVGYSHTQMPYITAMRGVDLSTVSRKSDANSQLAELGVEPALCSFFTQSLDVTDRRWRFNLDALAENMPAILGFPETNASHNGSTLFLSGALSDYVTRAHRPMITDLFPAARFAKIPKAGHWLHADDPRAFEANVKAYLDAPDV